MKKIRKRLLAMLLAIVTMLAGIPVDMQNVNAAEAESLSISNRAGWLESAYVTWKPVSGAGKYVVYYKTAGSSAENYVAIDDELIRNYGSYYRADILGLAAGKYDVKVTATANGAVIASNEATNLEVKAHAREGFAFWSKSTTGGKASGGYDNTNGTVPSNAQILYVTKDNVNTVTLDVIKDSKGTTTACTGLAEILTTRGKGYDKTPLIIRMIGMISTDDIDGLNSNGYLQVKECEGITIEGVGDDAVAYGWGFLIRNATNIEVRNLGLLKFADDGISMDTGNKNIWIHNIDFFYGSAGSDSDQVKGDGSCDMKKASSYITVSYNHFWDSGKASLCGLSESAEFFATYHHNWFDHSDSRHPRIRTGTIHIYNNYYDGNSKYGVGVTTGASAFVESNVFRNCKYPMMSSKQGSDIGNEIFSGENGGIIKAYNNEISGGKGVVYVSENSTQFDAYDAKTRDEQVPSSVKTYSGGTSYNNFDTASDMYAYQPTAVEDVVTHVSTYAGRMEGGDLTWEFDDASEDSDYNINSELMAAVTNYKSKLVSVGGTADGSSSGSNGSGEQESDKNTENSGNQNTENSGNQNTENSGNQNTENSGNQNTENGGSQNTENSGNQNGGSDSGNSGSQDMPSDPEVSADGFVAGGWFESIYAQWKDNNAKAAKVYYKTTDSADYTEVADAELIRQQSSDTGRVDIVGLTAGTYDIKVETASGETYSKSGVKVSNYDRSGYAHFRYTKGVGAYKDNGALKDNAIVIYVTEQNKNTVQIPGYESYATGIGNILNGNGNSKPLFTKLAEDGKPLVIRIVGTVTAPEGLTAYDSTENGGTKGDNGNMAIIRNAKDITVEGIGADAVINGWGISFYVTTGYENTESYEVRNVTFTRAPEDELGFQGAMTGSELTDPIERVWVHHNSFYPGYCANPAESDKAEGDGSCDFKRGQYYTMAYNYYEGCHKTNLIGASDSNLQFHITMHHNYYKDCASRIPLVRQSDIHIYNNYFEGSTSKNVDARADAFVYSEANYYDSCKNPILTTSGAVVKSYNDVFYNCTEDNNGNLVSDRTKTVSSDSTYANFDTNADVFYYDTANKKSDVTYLTDAATAKADCKALSGVMKQPEKIDMSPEKESMLAYTPSKAMSLPYSIQFTDKSGENYAGSKMEAAGVSTLAASTPTELDGMIINAYSKYSTTSTALKIRANGITFKTASGVKVTLAEPSSSGKYGIVLYDAYGEVKLTVTDGTGSAQLPAGTYMIQCANAEKDGYIESLSLEWADVETPGEGDSENPGSGSTENPEEGDSENPGSGSTENPEEGENDTPAVTITNAKAPVITAQPVGNTYAYNTPASLSVTAQSQDGGVLSYQWYKNTTAGATAIAGAVSASYIPTTTVAGTTYYYCVVTNTNNNVNGTKTASTTSSVAVVTVKPVATSNPTVTTKATNLITGVKDTYKKVVGNKAFTLKAAAQGTITYASSDKKVATVNATTGKVTIKGAGKAVITITASGNASYEAGTKQITIQVAPKKQVIRSVEVVNGKSVTVTWKKDKKAKGYQIQYATKKNFKNAKTMTIKKNKTTKVKFTKLKAGKKYYVRVRAFGKSNVYGSWSKAKPMTVKK